MSNVLTTVNALFAKADGTTERVEFPARFAACPREGERIIMTYGRRTYDCEVNQTQHRITIHGDGVSSDHRTADSCVRINITGRETPREK